MEITVMTMAKGLKGDEGRYGATYRTHDGCLPVELEGRHVSRDTTTSFPANGLQAENAESVMEAEMHRSRAIACELPQTYQIISDRAGGARRGRITA